MKENKLSVSWHKQHASALFLGALLSSSVVLMISGFYLQQQGASLLDVAGNLLIQLSGAALAASVATAFLGFSDVRDSLAQSLSRLFSEGDVVGLLSHETNRVIGENITLKRISDSTLSIEPSLYEHILRISDNCLSAAHVHNYNIRDSITDHPERYDLLIREVAISFKVVTHHLKESSAIFPYKFFYQLPLSYADTLKVEDLLLGFDANLGERQFKNDDVDVSKVTSGGAEFLRFEFDESILVKNELDVYVNFRAIAIRKDNASVVRARFPTHGFSVSLVSATEQNYDGSWLKTKDFTTENLPSKREIRVLANGISAVTNNWILPGEGVVFSWSPKVKPC